VTSGASAELVGWWKCNEGSGTIARDASRYGNDASFHGDPQWAAGHFNGGLEFDGSGDYLDRGVYTPSSTLDYGKTYFWRIDEVNAPPDSAVHKGDVWSFTTEPIVYALPGDKITATASSSQDGGPEKTIDGSGLVNDLHSINTKAMWLSAAGDPGSAWIRYDFDTLYKLRQMLVWNYNGPLLLSGFGVKNATIEYSADGVTWTVLPGTNTFAKASGKDGYACNATVDLGGIVAKSVRITANSNWAVRSFASMV